MKAKLITLLLVLMFSVTAQDTTKFIQEYTMFKVLKVDIETQKWKTATDTIYADNTVTFNADSKHAISIENSTGRKRMFYPFTNPTFLQNEEGASYMVVDVLNEEGIIARLTLYSDGIVVMFKYNFTAYVFFR